MSDGAMLSLHSLFDTSSQMSQAADPSFRDIDNMQDQNFSSEAVNQSAEQIFSDSVDNFTNNLKTQQAEIYDMFEGSSHFFNVDKIFNNAAENIDRLEAAGQGSQEDKVMISARAIMDANMEVSIQAMEHVYKIQEMQAYTQLVHGSATKVPETFRTLTQG